MIPVNLSRLVMVENHDSQTVLLEEAEATGEPRRLTLLIGANEAAELSRCLQKETSKRPLTHQLAANLLTASKSELERAVIHNVQGGTYFAELHLQSHGERVLVDCRPSDALALCLRLGAPIFVTEEVLSASSKGAQ